MLTTDGSLPQQLGVVWSRLLEADSEGPSFISHAACARSVSSSRTFLSCACGALSIAPVSADGPGEELGVVTGLAGVVADLLTGGPQAGAGVLRICQARDPGDTGDQRLPGR